MIALANTNWIEVGSLGSFAAALATVVLAVITRRIANKTNDVAEVTRDLAEETKRLALATEQAAQAAQAAVEAVEEPFVIAVPTPLEVFDVLEEDHVDGIHRGLAQSVGPIVRLRLWNIGMGPAIVEQVSLSRPGEADCVGALPGGFRPVGAGQVADMEIPSPRWPAVIGDGTLTIQYTHADGRSYETRSEASIGDPVVTCLTYARSRL
jgi:hypothetical protein